MCCVYNAAAAAGPRLRQLPPGSAGAVVVKLEPLSEASSHLQVSHRHVTWCDALEWRCGLLARHMRLMMRG